MPEYRGLLRNERVAIYHRVTRDDGMCGTYPEYPGAPDIPRYWCRMFFNEEEKIREATGEERSGAWTMFGSPIDLREGDKVLRASGQAFTVVSVRKPLDGRVQHHLRAILRKVEGVSSAN